MLYDPRWPRHVAFTLGLKSERQISIFAPDPTGCGICSFDFCSAALLRVSN